MTCRRCKGTRLLRVPVWDGPVMIDSHLKECPSCEIWMKVDQAEHYAPHKGFPDVMEAVYRLRDDA